MKFLVLVLSLVSFATAFAGDDKAKKLGKVRFNDYEDTRFLVGGQKFEHIVVYVTGKSECRDFSNFLNGLKSDTLNFETKCTKRFLWSSWARLEISIVEKTENIPDDYVHIFPGIKVKYNGCLGQADRRHIPRKQNFSSDTVYGIHPRSKNPQFDAPGIQAVMQKATEKSEIKADVLCVYSGDGKRDAYELAIRVGRNLLPQ